jgi:hypothetical protein
MQYTLYPENSSLIDEHWFQSQLNRYEKNAYKACYEEEVAALQAFYNGETGIEQAATAITRPITNSPIHDLGGYSDDAVAICQLWSLFRCALIEWPQSRTADLVALLSATTRVTDLIHRGKLLDDDDEKPLSWAEHPFFQIFGEHQGRSQDKPPMQPPGSMKERFTSNNKTWKPDSLQSAYFSVNNPSILRSFCALCTD